MSDTTNSLMMTQIIDAAKLSQSVRNSHIADKNNAKKHVFNGKRSITPNATKVGRN